MEVHLSSDEDAGDDFFVTLFNTVQEFYRGQVFCDLFLFCQGGDQWSTKVVKCHTIVLASVVPAIKNLVRYSDWDPVHEAHCVFLPDVGVDVVKEFVDNIYEKLVTASDKVEIQVNDNLADVLGLKSSKDYSKSSQKPSTILPEKDIPRTNSGEIDYEAFNENAYIAKAMKGQKAETAAATTTSQAPKGGRAVIRINDTGSNPFLLDFAPPNIADMIHITDGKIELSQGAGKQGLPLHEGSKENENPISHDDQNKRKGDPLPDAPPSKKQPPLPFPRAFADEPVTHFSTTFCGFNRSVLVLEGAVHGFVRSSGVFRAATLPYYTTQRIVDDKQNVFMAPSGISRQFRMKLPTKKFVALVAVGMRYFIFIMQGLSFINY